jgi:regulator of replication initiation timing
MANKRIKNLKEKVETKKRLQEQLESVLIQNSALRLENSLLRTIPKLEQGHLSTMFIAVEKITDALAHVITDLRRVVR